MILIILSKEEYINETHDVVKAFYPNEQVKAIVELENFEDAIKNDFSLELSENNKTTGKSDVILKFLIKLEDKPKITVYKDMAQLYSDSGTTALSDKKQYRNSLKRMLYHCLSALTGRELPWGTLTGVRPVKIAYEKLEQGITKTDITNYMKEQFLCSDEKIEISLQVAERELTLLREMDYRKGYSIYIGIPFCPSTCLYCSFTSYSLERFGGVIEQYLQALFKEIAYAGTCFKDKKLSTVYLGGGTPTTLSEDQLDRLLGFVRSNFDFTYVKEFTVEAGRPDSITEDKLKILKKYGVTRISINPQTMRQKTLDLIGRKHTVEQIVEAFHMARELGHDNINMDIILGLPGESKEDVAYTLQEIDKLKPDSLTVHTLALKRAARLNLEKEAYEDMQATDVADMLELSIDYARQADYLPYYLYRQKNMSDNLENIGYAKFGKEGLYNILIMEEKQTILALGAGALSKFIFYEENRIERVENVKSLTDYINRIDEMIGRKQDFLNKHFH